MAKTDLVCCLLHRYDIKLRLTEKMLLEVKLITRVCHELSEFFKTRYGTYQHLIQLDREDNMKSIRFIQEVVKDILSTQEYTLSGIAIYTHIHEDVLYDLLAGVNVNPTFEVCKKILELHVSVRRNLYDDIMKKIVVEYFDKRT